MEEEKIELQETHKAPDEPELKTTLPIFKNKFFLGFMALSFIVAFIVGGLALAPKSTKTSLADPSWVYCEQQGGVGQSVTNPDGSGKADCVFQDGRKCDTWDFYRTKKCTTPTPSPSPTASSSAKSYLAIPEYGVKFALTENIKDAYYLPETADKGYVYLKARALDSEPKCKSDPSSTAALSKVGKDDINPMSESKFSTSFEGATIGNYFYYIDLAQYACGESAAGKALLDKVRKEFGAASKTITAL